MKWIAHLVVLLLFAVIALPCLILWPVRLLIDRAARKHCLHCADRAEQYEIIYQRPNGTYVCARCGKRYDLRRT